MAADDEFKKVKEELAAKAIAAAARRSSGKLPSKVLISKLSFYMPQAKGCYWFRDASVGRLRVFYSSPRG
eukprot:3146502-Lingulodinium_polyedra.AAC.1